MAHSPSQLPGAPPPEMQAHSHSLQLSPCQRRLRLRPSCKATSPQLRGPSGAGFELADSLGVQGCAFAAHGIRFCCLLGHRSYRLTAAEGGEAAEQTPGCAQGAMQELNSDDEYEIDYEEELSQGAQEHGCLMALALVCCLLNRRSQHCHFYHRREAVCECRQVLEQRGAWQGTWAPSTTLPRVRAGRPAACLWVPYIPPRCQRCC